MEPDRETLDVAAILPCSVANGPGKRFVIWLQGCTFNCVNCINPEFQELGAGKKTPIYELIEVIKDSVNTNHISGITFSGGEPLLQSGPLKKLVSMVKDLELSVFLFTGFTQDELNKEQKEVWEMADIIISGRYVQELHTDEMNWIASSNQQIIVNNPDMNRYVPSENICEIRIKEDGSVVLTGFPEDISFLEDI